MKVVWKVCLGFLLVVKVYPIEAGAPGSGREGEEG
jgi:hypothetical protein